LQGIQLLRHLARNLEEFELGEDAEEKCGGDTGGGAASLACDFPEDPLTWASGSSTAVPTAMYVGSIVSDVTTLLPDALRGVFWLKGGDGSQGHEELISLQYGKWFPSELVLIVPEAPFTRAWAASAPEKANASGKYEDPLSPRREAWSTRYARARSWVFSDKSLAHAWTQVHAPYGDLLGTPASDKFAQSSVTTFAATPGTNGSSWRCTEYTGWNECNYMQVSSYGWEKIISSDGNFVRPAYDQFVDFMGKSQLFFHTGWKNKSGMQAWASFYYGATVSKDES
jgi:hypothetical protein